MKRGSRFALLAFVFLVFPGSLRSESSLPDAFSQQIRSAAELCKKRDLEAAAQALQNVYDEALKAYGPGHSVPEIVGMNLDTVERARGRKLEPRSRVLAPQGEAADSDREPLQSLEALALLRLQVGDRPRAAVRAQKSTHLGEFRVLGNLLKGRGPLAPGR